MRDTSDSFASKPVWQRVCILAAGVASNLILAVAIFIFSFAIGMPQVIDSSEDAARAAMWYSYYASALRFSRRSGGTSCR